MRHLDWLSATLKPALAHVSDESLALELSDLQKQWDESRSDPDDEGHGGSPGEWMWERIGELDQEIARRKKSTRGVKPRRSKRKVTMTDNRIPRRIRLDLATPPEAAIRAAMKAVDGMPADVRLTRAENKLQEALDLVADYVDEQFAEVALLHGPGNQKE